MEAIDPNLIKAGTTDYSWISNGVDNGIKYAQTKMHLDQQQQLIQAHLQELQQKGIALQVQKVKSIGADFNDAMNEVGGVRKAKLGMMQAKADQLGITLPDDVMAAATDPAYEDTMKQFAANLTSNDPNMQKQALPLLLQSGLSMKTVKSIGGLTEQNAKQMQDAQIASQKSSDYNRRTDAVAGGAETKLQNNLGTQAQGIEKTYAPLIDKPQQAIDLLNKGTASDDTAAAQLFIRSMGNERVTNAAIAANTTFGSAIDKATQSMNQLGTGQKFAPSQRADLIGTLKTLQQGSSDEFKTRMDPIVQRANQDPKLQKSLLSGQIVPTKHLQQFWPDIAGAGNGSKSSASSADVTPPQPGLSSRTALERNLISSSVSAGKSLATINQGLKNAVPPRTPLSAQEYTQFQKAGATPAPQPQASSPAAVAPSDQSASAPESLSDAMPNGPTGSILDDDGDDTESGGQ